MPQPEIQNAFRSTQVTRIRLNVRIRTPSLPPSSLNVRHLINNAGIARATRPGLALRLIV